MSELRDPRIMFAAERTLLAWNRTSIAFMAFGFLIERSGILIRVISGSATDSFSTTLTIWIGFLFILSGALVALYSSKQYARLLKTLDPADFPVGYSAKWGIAVNIGVAALGLLLALALLLAP